jgi:hypothetical protein
MAVYSRGFKELSQICSIGILSPNEAEEKAEIPSYILLLSKILCEKNW